MEKARRPRRLLGALALDPATYEEIAEDGGALPGAVLVVIGATLLAGLGGLLWTQWGGKPPDTAIYASDVRRFIARSVIVGGALQVVLWGVMVQVTRMYLSAFGEQVSMARLARAMGYAFAPVGLQLFVCPPGLELAAGVAAFGYAFAAMVAAVQAAVQTTPGRAAVSVLAGFALFAVALSLLGNGSGRYSDLAPGIFPLDPLPISVGVRSAR